MICDSPRTSRQNIVLLLIRNLRLWCLIPIIDEGKLGTLARLLHNNITGIPALTIVLLKSPNLRGRPIGVLAHGMAHDEVLALALHQPILLEELVLDLVQADKLAATLDSAK